MTDANYLALFELREIGFDFNDYNILDDLPDYASYLKQLKYLIINDEELTIFNFYKGSINEVSLNTILKIRDLIDFLKDNK